MKTRAREVLMLIVLIKGENLAGGGVELIFIFHVALSRG